jgi:beta-1,4-N-acetylglucosaminyltransferase
MQIVGICSGGGHLTEMLLVAQYLPSLPLIVTETQSALRNREVFVMLPICDPHRSVLKFALNFIQSLRYLFSLSPDVVITTGAGISVPFFILARISGRTCIYIETGARVTTVSLTGRILYPFSNLFIVQHNGLKGRFSRAVVCELF